MKNFVHLLNRIKLAVEKLDSLQTNELLSKEEQKIVNDNWKKIHTICNEKYSNQRFHGGAALNRLILLDPQIAKLLTPETIIALYIDYESRGIKPFIITNSGSTLVFTDVLHYGFEMGLETIKLLPNNEIHYDLKAYEQQQEKFAKNTLEIIKNIELAARRLKINLDDLEEEKELDFKLS